MIEIDDFLRCEIRVGRILRAEVFPKARKPAYKLWLDFGEHGERTSSAQIVDLYKPDQLTGRLVLAVLNLPARQVADFVSEVLILGVPQQDGAVALIQPDRELAPGSRVF